MKKRSQAAESWFNLLFWQAGLFAFLFIINDTVGLTYSRTVVYVCAVLFSSGLYLLQRFVPRKYQWIAVILLPLLGAWAALRNTTLQNEFTAVFNHLFGTNYYHEKIKNVTAAVCFAAAVFSYLIYLLTGVLHVYWILYILTTALLIGICLAGISPGFLTVLCMLVFQVSFWVREGNRKKGNFSAIPVIVTAGLCLAFALISWYVVGKSAGTFYAAANRAEGWIVNTFRKESGRGSDYDGIVNRGNIYPEHVPLYEIVLKERPVENIYLRTFIGKDYQNGYWYTDDETSLLAGLDELSGLNENESNAVEEVTDPVTVSEQAAKELPYLWYDLNTLFTEDQEPQEMIVRIVNNNVRDMWPDLPVGRPMPELESAWDGRIRTDGGIVYNWLRREKLSFAAEIISDLSESLPDAGETADSVETAETTDETMDEQRLIQLYQYYMNAAPSRYLYLPEDQVPKLVWLCRQNPIKRGNVEETTAFITYCLNHLAAYTTTPGLVPLGADPVEYALFESRRGYCQHFSSAAVLMYRYYGIASRYVSGYRAKPTSFHKEDDGYYHAWLTEEDAHSWTEILTESAGWAPVDLTPGRISTHESVPGMDLSLVSGYLSRSDWNLEGYAAEDTVREIQLSEIQIDDTVEEEEPEEPVELPHYDVPIQSDMEYWEEEVPEEPMPLPIEILPKEKNWFEKMMEERWFRLLFWFGGIPLAGAVLFFLVRLIVILRYRMASVRKIFSWIMDDLHYTGFLENYNGTEGDIVEALTRTLPTVSEEEAKYYVRQAETDAFSRKKGRRMRNTEMRRFHIKVAADIFTKGNNNLRKDMYSFRCFMRAIG